MNFKRLINITIYTTCLWVCTAHGSEFNDREQELEQSLQEFDEKILQELEEAQQAREENARQQAVLHDAALEAEDEGSGEEQSEDQGQDSGQGGNEGGDQTASTENSQTSDESNETAMTAGQENTDQASREVAGELETTESTRSAAGGQEQQTSTNPQYEDIPSGNDDDVIARQLREAAEAETDPEIKEKLWEEYRKYKNQQSPGA